MRYRLAELGCFIRALGEGYGRITKKTNSSANEATIRECMCVFEDKLMRYGPFFVWAAVAGSPIAHAWHNFVIQEGLSDLQAFESGRTAEYSSLQSVLWHQFCKKAGCSSIVDSWVMALHLILKEMGSYVLIGPK
jgi:hypothetical protein